MKEEESLTFYEQHRSTDLSLTKVRITVLLCNDMSRFRCIEVEMRAANRRRSLLRNSLREKRQFEAPLKSRVHLMKRTKRNSGLDEIAVELREIFWLE